MSRFLSAALAVLCLLIAAPNSIAATLTVNSSNDNVALDGQCTLREAIIAVNTGIPPLTFPPTLPGDCGVADGNNDRIEITVPNVFLNTNGTNEDAAQTGDLDILNDVVIVGIPASTLNANNDHRTFQVHDNTNVTLERLALNGGFAFIDASAILNTGNLTIVDSSINNFFSASTIINTGTLNVLRSSIYNNTADPFLGAAPVAGQPGIINSGTLTVVNTTFFSNNSFGSMGFEPAVIATGSGGTARIINSTIGQNRGAFGIGFDGNGSLELLNNIIADNDFGDCFGTPTSVGVNLSSQAGCNATIVGPAGFDGLVIDFNQSLFYLPLDRASAAIDAGDNTVCADAATVANQEQRGTVSRLHDGNRDGVVQCDLGAIERHSGFTVDSMQDASDDNPGDGNCNDTAGNCSLRAAIEESNALSGVDIISVPVGDYPLSIFSPLSINADTSLIASGDGLAVIDASSINRSVSFIGAQNGNTPDVELIQLGLTGGNNFNGSGLTLDAGNLLLDNSEVYGNSASSSFGGAGIQIDFSTTAIITNSSIYNNQIPPGDAGGIFSLGELTLINSTISGNLGGDVETNETGGINISNGSAVIINSTITDNSGVDTDGLYVGLANSISIINTVIGDQSGTGTDCGGNLGSINTRMNNADSDGSCGFSLTTAPLLAALADNGGFTQTHLPDLASGLIDAGDSATCNDPDTVNNLDQRGRVRPASSLCTIGSVEPPKPPNLMDDNVTTLEDTDALFDVLSNDSDPESRPLTITAVSTPDQGGTATVEGGQIRYQPTADFNGTESFTYTVTNGDAEATATVTVTVTAVNDRPIANDDSFTVNEDSANNSLGVTLNDTDVDDTNFQVVFVSATTQNGSASIGSDGRSINYTPAANFAGTDQFSYRISDGEDTSRLGIVTVTVTDDNDPTDNQGPVENRAPVAQDDSFNVTEDSSNNMLAVLLNDSDADGDTLAIISLTQPNQGGQVSIGNGGSVINYSPAANFNGTETFSYTISDGELSSQATVTMTVSDDNDPDDNANPGGTTNTAPTANNDSFTVPEDSLNNMLAVLLNDSDADGDNLAIVQLGQTNQGGRVSIGSNGAFINYSPAANFNGTETFSYTVSDGSLSSQATVRVTVADDNDPVDDLPMNSNGNVSGGQTVVSSGAAGDTVSAGSVTVSNSSDDVQNIVSFTIAVSNTDIISRLAVSLNGEELGVSNTIQSSTRIVLNTPLNLPAGSQAQFTFSARLAADNTALKPSHYDNNTGSKLNALWQQLSNTANAANSGNASSSLMPLLPLTALLLCLGFRRQRKLLLPAVLFMGLAACSSDPADELNTSVGIKATTLDLTSISATTASNGRVNFAGLPQRLSILNLDE